MRAEGQSGELSDFARSAHGKFGMRVEAGADSGAANGEIVEAVESDGNASAIAVEKIHIAGKFLAESERRGVLQMRATDFYDVGEFLGFGVKRVAKIFQRREQAARRFRGGGDVHGGGKRVIRGLRHIYIVIGVDGLLAAHFAAADFDSAV